MTTLNPRSAAAGLVLTLSLLACPSLEAGVVTAIKLGSSPLTVTDSGTAGSYGFADFSGDFQATLVSISVTGTATGAIQLDTNGTPDYTSPDDGDRLLLGITDNSTSAFNGITLTMVGTTFDVTDGIDPSRGAFSSNTYTSDPNQRISSSGVTINSSTDTILTFTFNSTLAVGGTTYFYLLIVDNGSLVNGEISLEETPSVASVPEPAAIVPLGLALLGLAGLRRRFGD
jgi:hypothetical protein